MSEELTKLIDKTVGKKGRLRVPAYWMHKVLSGIVGYVKEQVEKLEKSLASTSEKLSGEIATVKAGLPEVRQITTDAYGQINLETFKPCFIMRCISGDKVNLKEVVNGEYIHGLYTLYAFFNGQSDITNMDDYFLPPQQFGLYKLSILHMSSNRDNSPGGKYLELTKILPSAAYAYAKYHISVDNEKINFAGVGHSTSIVGYKTDGKRIGYSDNPGSAAGIGIWPYMLRLFANHISDQLFMSHPQLTEIEWTSPGTSIGDNAFRGCQKLEKVGIPENVTSIGLRAFYGCQALKSITIPGNVYEIGEYAFLGSGLTEIVVPESVRIMGHSVFADCSFLKKAELLAPVLQDALFKNCTSLTEVTIPDGVTFIGDWAFENCTSLTEVVIPESVTFIGDWAFGNCTSLQTVDFSSHTAIPTLGSSVFNGVASDFKIIVPDALYDDWIVASNWSTYADHIVKASEYVETE